VLDAIETLSQRGIFFFQGVETLNDRALITCSCCCGGRLKREDSDSTPNNSIELHVGLLSNNNAALKRLICRISASSARPPQARILSMPVPIW
jgi:hypothetical protein